MVSSSGKSPLALPRPSRITWAKSASDLSFPTRSVGRVREDAGTGCVFARLTQPYGSQCGCGLGVGKSSSPHLPPPPP